MSDKERIMELLQEKLALIDQLNTQMKSNEALARESVALVDQYEILVPGELRQIIHYMLVMYGVTRNEFALWGFDAEIYDAIVREFGEGRGADGT